MYKVYGGAKSRTFRVLWMLEELGQAYEHHPEKPRTDPVRAVNASGKIPVLVDGDTPVRDSAAILTYLTDKHGAFTHAPGTLDRARQDAWLHTVNDEIDAVLWTAARHSFILPEDLRVPAVKDTCKWEYGRNIDRMMEQMEGDYLMGDEPTVPDFILAHCGGWAKNAGFPADNAAFGEYLRRMRGRAAFRKLTD